MCEIFLFPYNRKMWKRPLSALAPSGFTWNITHPDFEQVLRGAFEGEVEFEFKAYNSSGWYPRPPAGAAQRGMECLSAALASQTADLRCGCEVVAIHPERREVSYRRSGRIERIEYGDALLSTLPLPTLLTLCEACPPECTAHARGSRAIACSPWRSACGALVRASRATGATTRTSR